MLQGDVQIFQYLLFPRDHINEPFVHLIRIQIVEPNPMEVQFAQLLQQVRQMVPPIPVRPVAGDVLSHHDELLHAPGRQLPSLRQDLVHGTAAVLSPELGDDAEGAPVVAPLRDAEVGVPGRRGQHPAEFIHRGIEVTKVPGMLPGHHVLHGGDDVLVAPGAQDAVHLRQLRGDVLPIALGHAAGHQDLFQFSRR